MSDLIAGAAVVVAIALVAYAFKPQGMKERARYEPPSRNLDEAE